MMPLSITAKAEKRRRSFQTWAASAQGRELWESQRLPSANLAPACPITNMEAVANHDRQWLATAAVTGDLTFPG